MFRVLLAHLQEELHKLHLVYCVRVVSVGCYQGWFYYTDILRSTVNRTLREKDLAAKQNNDSFLCDKQKDQFCGDR
jgi:hypothetical protein